MHKQILFQLRGPGWPGRVLAVLIGALLLVAGLFFGLIVLALAAGAALALGLRAWWLRRRGRTQPPGSDVDPARPGRLIEGDYRVVERSRRRD